MDFVNILGKNWVDYVKNIFIKKYITSLLAIKGIYKKISLMLLINK